MVFRATSAVVFCGGLLMACGAGNGAEESLLDRVSVGGGKGDMVQSAHIIDDIAPNSLIDGRFDDRVRVYGFTVEAKAGATISVEITTKAGANSSDVAEGKPLDTIAAFYGPMVGEDRGPRLAQADDDPLGGTSGQLPAVKLEQDGRYLVLMATWNDPGKGTYRIEVGCDGTDFQCRRPVLNVPCDNRTRYITGGTVIGTETWKACKVVLVEHVEVAEGAELTIQPGVNVQGNYVGNDQYGTVDLVVNGTLQAVGTADYPVVFSSLKEGKGWKGLVLKGDSNTIRHAYVEGAKVGLEVHGSNNTFVNLDINTGDTGLHVTKTSTVNKAQHLRIAKVRDGIRLEGAVDILDTVILGLGADTESGSGIWGNGATEKSLFHRALIANFPHGLYLHSTELEVYDSTIVNNKRGVFVTGDNAGVHPSYTCPTFPQAPPQVFRPSPPATWGRDPVFIRCDIINNTEWGIKISAPELLVVEQSNIRGNGRGILVDSDSLHVDSRVAKNNVYENGAAAQVESWHVNGTLDISGNYWAQLSDPELSASWLMTHTDSRTCRENRNPHGNCTRHSSRHYTCGAYSCKRSGSWRCTATATSSWSGQFTFTGFSPAPLQAGPEITNITQKVQDERQKYGL